MNNQANLDNSLPQLHRLQHEALHLGACGTWQLTTTQDFRSNHSREDGGVREKTEDELREEMAKGELKEGDD